MVRLKANLLAGSVRGAYPADPAGLGSSAQHPAAP